MTKYLMAILVIITSLTLILGSSSPLQTQVQDKASKSRTTQKTQKRQEEGKPSPDVTGYWQALAARSKAPLAVSWNEGTGTPQSIMGKLSAPVSGASEASARSFLVGNAPLFKMSGDTGDLELVRSFDSLIGEHFIFAQTYRGIPVYGAQVSIHFDRAGDIVSVNNSYQPGVALRSVTPTLNRTDAEARVSGLIKNASKSDSTLVALGLNGTFMLAWRVVVPTDGPTWETFIDATYGKALIGPRDINRYVDGTGQVYNVNAIVATHDKVFGTTPIPRQQFPQRLIESSRCKDYLATDIWMEHTRLVAKQKNRPPMPATSLSLTAATTDLARRWVTTTSIMRNAISNHLASTT